MDDINDLEIRGESAAAPGRLEWLRGLVDGRRKMLDGPQLVAPPWAQGPAFEVHIRSGIAVICGEKECWLNLRHAVVYGRIAHVVIFLHEPVVVCSIALAGVSGFLAAEFVASQTLRPAYLQVARS